MDDGVMTRKEGADTSTITFKRGDVRWRPASGPYTAENTSDHPIRILEIDLKGAPAGPLPVTTLDPVAVDPTALPGRRSKTNSSACCACTSAPARRARGTNTS